MPSDVVVISSVDLPSGVWMTRSVYVPSSVGMTCSVAVSSGVEVICGICVGLICSGAEGRMFCCGPICDLRYRLDL